MEDAFLTEEALGNTMRLVDFLIAVLAAHGQTLQRLAALFGEDWLMEILEKAGDETSPTALPAGKVVRPARLDLFETGPAHGTQSSAYAALESSIHEMNLAAPLEFHLWAYPHYRAFIESPLDLNSRIITDPSGESGTALVDEAIAQAQKWIKQLPIPVDLSKRAEAAAQVPWLRFRTDVLRRIGKRPLGAV